VAFRGNNIAGGDRGHLVTDTFDPPAELVADRHAIADAFAKDRISIVDMNVTAANGGHQYAHQNVVRPDVGQRRVGDVPESYLSIGFDQGFHQTVSSCCWVASAAWKVRPL
jgi:hypothetical protein